MKRISVNSYVFDEKVNVLVCKDKTRTQQSFAEEVDVNNIVARAIKTGLLADPNAINARQAVFGDFSAVGSYQEALNKVVAAQSAFNSLPANVRSRFNNDPANLIAFMADPANLDEAVDLGLVVKKVVPDYVAPVSGAKVPVSEGTPEPKA